MKTDPAAAETRLLKKIGTRRAVATFRIDQITVGSVRGEDRQAWDNPRWFIEFPDGLDGWPAPFTLSRSPSKEAALSKAQACVAAAYEFTGDPSRISVEIEWTNDVECEKYLAHETELLASIPRTRVIATFIVNRDLEKVHWLIEFPDPLNDDERPDASKTGAGRGSKTEVARLARDLVARANDHFQESSGIPLDIEWRNEALHEAWVAGERWMKRPILKDLLRRPWTPYDDEHAVATFYPGPAPLWLIEARNSYHGSTQPDILIGETEPGRPLKAVALAVARFLRASSLDCSPAAAEKWSEIEWRNEDAYAGWLDEQAAVRKTIRPCRAIATFTDGDSPHWGIRFGKVRDTGLGTGDPVIRTRYDEHRKENAVAAARRRVAKAHGYLGDPSEVPVELEWRNEPAYERWLAGNSDRQALAEKQLMEMGVISAVAMFRSEHGWNRWEFRQNRRDYGIVYGVGSFFKDRNWRDGGRRYSWRASFPDGLGMKWDRDSNLPMEIGRNFGFGILNSCQEEIGMSRVLRRCQERIAEAFEIPVNPARIRIRMHWIGVKRYKRWLARRK